MVRPKVPTMTDAVTEYGPQNVHSATHVLALFIASFFFLFVFFWPCLLFFNPVYFYSILNMLYSYVYFAKPISARSTDVRFTSTIGNILWESATASVISYALREFQKL